MKKRNGFTLVELVVVIAILSAVAIPTFSFAIDSANRNADIQLMRTLNTRLIIGEIDGSDIKDQELKTKGWELYYSQTQRLVAIVDENGIIIAAWDDKIVGIEATKKGYVCIADINGGNETEENQPIADEWKNAYVVSHSLPTDDAAKDKLLQSVEIYLEDSVEVIPDEYFKASEIKRIYIGKGITEIPKSAFYNCKKLTEVVISGKVTSIGNKAFGGCTALKTLNLSDIQSVGNYAFADCDFDDLILRCAETCDPDNEFTVRNLKLVGGEANVDFANWVGNILANETNENMNITVTNTVFTENTIFKNAKSGMTIYIDESSYNSYKSADFGKATVIKLWEQTP